MHVSATVQNWQDNYYTICVFMNYAFIKTWIESGTNSGIFAMFACIISYIIHWEYYAPPIIIIIMTGIQAMHGDMKCFIILVPH